MDPLRKFEVLEEIKNINKERLEALQVKKRELLMELVTPLVDLLWTCKEKGYCSHPFPTVWTPLVCYESKMAFWTDLVRGIDEGIVFVLPLTYSAFRIKLDDNLNPVIAINQEPYRKSFENFVDDIINQILNECVIYHPEEETW